MNNFDNILKIPYGWLLYHTEDGMWRVESPDEAVFVEGADLESVLEEKVNVLHRGG